MKHFFPELPILHQRQGYQFYFSSNCPCIEAAISRVLSQNPPAADILKQDHKRLLFKATDTQGNSFIVKVNLLPRFKDKLRAKRFAPQEYYCHSRIATLGLPVPPLWGYFHKQSLGLQKQNGLIIGFLQGTRNLKPEEGVLAAPIVAALCDQGINHPDLMCNNIMLRESDQSIFLIDLESCSFEKPGDIRLPLMNLARYIEYNQDDLHSQANQEMIRRSHAMLKEPQLGLEDFRNLIAILHKYHLKTRQRISLSMPDEAAQELRRLLHK